MALIPALMNRNDIIIRIYWDGKEYLCGISYRPFLARAGMKRMNSMPCQYLLALIMEKD